LAFLASKSLARCHNLTRDRWKATTILMADLHAAREVLPRGSLPQEISLFALL
jgi:hypothetical protein